MDLQNYPPPKYGFFAKKKVGKKVALNPLKIFFSGPNWRVLVGKRDSRSFSTPRYTFGIFKVGGDFREFRIVANYI